MRNGPCADEKGRKVNLAGVAKLFDVGGGVDYRAFLAYGREQSQGRALAVVEATVLSQLRHQRQRTGQVRPTKGGGGGGAPAAPPVTTK
jgi:hypothetical protein